jgi:hypothetical protein
MGKYNDFYITSNGFHTYNRYGIICEGVVSVNLENYRANRKANKLMPHMLGARVVRITFAHEEESGLKSRITQCLSETYLERLKQSDKEVQT